MEKNAQELFDLIISKGATIIEGFASEHKPENVILDFKEKSNPDGSKPMSQDDKNNYAKALSGFANSSGGVLVWGVGERRIDDFMSAYHKKPISNLARFVQNLETLLPEAVVPRVEGVRNEPIKISDNQDRGYVVTLIPESVKPPHRAELKLHQYYKRSGDSFRAMEHFDIEDMFGRRTRPDLVLNIGFKTIDTGQGMLHKYKLIAKIKNEGRGLSKYYGFDIQFPRSALTKSEIGDAISKPDRIQIRDDTVDLVTLSYRSKKPDPPIFPGETITILPNNYYGGHVNYCVDGKVFSDFDNRELKLNIYCDGAATKDSMVSFSDLNEF